MSRFFGACRKAATVGPLTSNWIRWTWPRLFSVVAGNATARDMRVAEPKSVLCRNIGLVTFCSRCNDWIYIQ